MPHVERLRQLEYLSYSIYRKIIIFYHPTRKCWSEKDAINNCARIIDINWTVLGNQDIDSLLLQDSLTAKVPRPYVNIQFSHF